MNNRNYDHLRPNAVRFRKINLSRPSVGRGDRYLTLVTAQEVPG